MGLYGILWKFEYQINQSIQYLFSLEKLNAINKIGRFSQVFLFLPFFWLDPKETKSQV